MKYILILVLIILSMSIKAQPFLLNGSEPEPYNLTRAQLWVTVADPDTISITSGTPEVQKGWTFSNNSFFSYDSETGRLTYTGSDRKILIALLTSSFKFGVGNQNVEGTWFYNGTEYTRSAFQRKIGTAGDIGDASCFFMIGVDTNDYIDFRWDASTSGDIIVDKSTVIILAF